MKFSRGLAAAALGGILALSAAPASAVTTQGAGSVTRVGDVLTFDWTATPFTGYLDFSVSTGFDLFFTSFAYDDESTQRSGVALLQNVGGIWEYRLSETSSACDSSPEDTLSPCQLVSKSGSFTTPSATVALVENLAAGDYRIGMYDSGNPDKASATFEISAVPLPFGAALLVTAFAGAGIVSRTVRRTA